MVKTLDIRGACAMRENPPRPCVIHAASRRGGLLCAVAPHGRSGAG